MRDNSLTSLSLLDRARTNEPDAWEKLVELYSPLVYHWCRQAGLSQDDTADVFQEVFQSVARNLARFHRERSGDSFRGWLRTITRNKVNDHFRRRGEAVAAGGSDAQMRIEAVADPLGPDDESSEENVTRQQLHQALAWIRGEFEERTWEAFWKVQMEEQGTDDVAAELGMTRAAVRKAKYRVLRRLREELKDLLF
jgi:RNA polymerase sigma-70 factor (ECF subfamily)